MFFIQWWQVLFFFPLLLKCHFSPFIIGLHIFYFVFCSAVLCLLWSSIPHFSMVIGFRKNYFQVTSVSCFLSDRSICFGDTNFHSTFLNCYFFFILLFVSYGNSTLLSLQSPEHFWFVLFTLQLVFVLIFTCKLSNLDLTSAVCCFISSLLLLGYTEDVTNISLKWCIWQISPRPQ